MKKCSLYINYYSKDIDWPYHYLIILILICVVCLSLKVDRSVFGKENQYSSSFGKQDGYFRKENFSRDARRDTLQEPAAHGDSTYKPSIHIPAPLLDPDQYHDYQHHHHHPHQWQQQQEEVDPEYSFYTERPEDISIASTTSSDRRVIKRKVLR